MVCPVCFFQTVFAQSPVNVNPLTGTANVTIPVFQINKGEVNVPINLSYNAVGVKPKDIEGSAGIGWYLSAGGQISRQLRGLPDDALKDNASTPNPRLGWLATANNNGTRISNFTVSNDNNTSTCSDETSDINYINSNFTGYSDTEPDIFNVSAPGLSCQLVFDKSKKLQVLSYQDIQAYYVYNATDGLITSFVITNNKGTQYVFDIGELTTQKAVPFAGTPVTYFGNTYNQYQNGITFYNNWYLSSITDVNGNTVSFNYIDGIQRGSSNPVELFIGGSTTKSTQYTIQQSTTQKILYSISNGKDQLVFQWLNNYYNSGGTNNQFISSITGMGRTFQFSYSPVGFLQANNNMYYRYFLRSYVDIGCNSPTAYSFTYYGETQVSSGTGYTTALTDSASTFTDYWGYQNTNNSGSLIPGVYVNPSNPAYPRYTNYNYPGPVASDYAYSLGVNGKYVDGNTITNGSLKTITNVNGGVTTLSYETNNYLDVPSNSVFSGNGIRIATIRDNDGINSANDIIRSYSYLDPVSGKSSGKPLTLPVYAFSIPYAGTATGKSYWDNASVLSVNDLSPDDHTVVYKYCRESKAGAGSTLYQYDVPATAWDNSATPGCVSCSTADWAPTQVYMGRSTCASYSPVKNDIYTYPFPPAANYDMERGLIRQVSNYNEAGTKVSESTYSYQRTGQPIAISALKFEDFNGVKAYAKYYINATTSELKSQITKKIYDSASLTQAQSSTINYTYGNNYHQLIKEKTTNSDNSQISVNTSYTRDYAIASPGADSVVNGIYHLQRKNVNIPVETYTQVTRGGVSKTISARLTKFKTINLPGNQYAYLPVQSLKIASPDGTTFTPFAVSSGAATNDPQYMPEANYTAYDNTGKLATADDNYRHVQTNIADQFSGQVVAIIKNAAINEIGFEDFDSALPLNTNFTWSLPSGITNSNSHLGNANTIFTGKTISKVISKKAGETNYILSAWINSSAAGTLTLTLTRSDGTASTYTEPFINTSSIARYFEWKVPVGNQTSLFTMNVSTNSNIYIDDILFYPLSAEASTYAYDPVTHAKIAATNTNGISAYYTNDQFGRLLFAYDQDKNIKERKTYNGYNEQLNGLSAPYIRNYTPSQPTTSAPISFETWPTPCITDVTYTWNFGDGSTVSVLNGNNQQHTYSAPGSYTVTVTASHPLYGSVSAQSSPITVKYPDLQPVICQSGATAWDNCPPHAVSTAACGTNPNDNTHSYYTITSVGNSGHGTLAYQWQISQDNGVNWSNTGTNASQLIIDYTDAGRVNPYKIRCIVTSTAGQTGTSNITSFNVVGCQ